MLVADPAFGVLAAHDIGPHTRLGPIRIDGAQHAHLLVAQRVGLERDGRLHGDERQQLQQVVLEDVATRTGLLVELAAALDAEVLGDGDLDMVHVAPVPERLEDAVAEAEDHQVADGLLAQVVVDAVDLRLVEDLDQRSRSAHRPTRGRGRTASRPRCVPSPRARPVGRGPRDPDWRRSPRYADGGVAR